MDGSDDDDVACDMSSLSQKEKFDDLLSKMNLADKHPQKLSLRDAIIVRKETLGTIYTTDQLPKRPEQQETPGTVHTTDQLPVLPYLILQKIMMCDQQCRSCLFKPSPSATQNKPIGSDSGNLSPSAPQNKPTGSDCDKSSDSESDDDSRLHPVDCMLTILHCCDDILRQDLISKLLLCQLAIPFLLPNPIDSSVTFLLWALRSLFCGWKCHNTGVKESRMVDYQSPIISFMRIGDL